MPETKQKPQRFAIMVLGMHRSGTSALAGTLGLLGCTLPKNLMRGNTSNELGHFEPQPLYNLHERLLDSACSHWADWLPIGDSWFDSPCAQGFQDEITDLLQAEFGSARQFVVKDPRICRLVPIWKRALESLDISPRYIHTHRDPLEVAASLKKRDAIDTDLGLLIWLRHLLDAEAGTRGSPRSFVNYAALLQSWGAVAQKIEHILDLKFPRFSPNVTSEIDAFIRQDLRHHNAQGSRVLVDPLIPGWVRDSFEIFERWSTTGESEADHARLDEVRAEFDKSGPIFAGIVRSGQLGLRETRRLTGEKQDLEQKWSQEAEKARHLEQALQEYKAEAVDKIAGLEKTIAQFSDREKELSKAAEEVGQWVETYQSAQKKHELEIRRLNKTISDYSSQFAEMAGLLLEKEEARSRLHQNLSGLRDRVAAQEAYIEALLNSNSWKVTWPLRSVARAIRKLLGRKDG
ncbi:sulfotransferase family protein [Paracoccus methylarcula]|nr:hypothetical protein [Paracoccus methylarcula]